MKTLAVMVPSRGRIPSLTKLVESFEQHTAHPEAFTMFVACDTDDKDTCNFITERAKTSRITIDVRIRERSPNLNRDYFNWMAEDAFSKAEYVWLLTNDCYVITPNWDDVLRKGIESQVPQDGLAYIGIEDGTPTPPGLPFRSPPYSAMPILSREAWKAQGFGFLHPSLLTWGADITLWLLWDHPKVRRTYAVPDVKVVHVCHHNGSAEQDAVNLDVEKRHLTQPNEIKRIVDYEIPGQAARLHSIIHSRNVWYCILPERCLYDVSHKMSMKVTYRAAQNGYLPIFSEYGRTDVVRQAIVESFMANSQNPHDKLVMLDIDMDHPVNVIERLAAWDKPVVAALYFRRGPAYEACAFRRNGDGGLHHLASFEPGLHRMDALGTGAICIERQAIEKLKAAGHHWLFQYEYQPNFISPSEDLYFSKLCEKAGIEMYVDTTFQIGHIGYGIVDQTSYEEYLKDNPQPTNRLKENAPCQKQPVT